MLTMGVAVEAKDMTADDPEGTSVECRCAKDVCGRHRYRKHGRWLG